MFGELIVNWLTKGKNSNFSDDNRIIEYSEVLEEARCIANALTTDLPARSVCAVFCESNLNAAISLLACWIAEMVPVPLSKNYGERHCAAIIDLIDPAIIISDCSLTGSNSWYDLKTHVMTNPCSQRKSDEVLEDIAVILCTSGTTGRPKGAMITESGLLSNIRDISEYFHISCNDTTLISRPLYHCAVMTGEFLVSLYSGANIRFTETSYNPLKIFSTIVKYKVTTMGGTPTFFLHLAQVAAQNNIKHNLKRIAVSGECLTAETAKRIRSMFLYTDIFNVYGLTEASPRVSYLDPFLFDQYPDYVGKPLASVSLRIVDVQGTEVPIDSDGLLQVRGQNVMKGYFKNPELTKKTIIDGWLNTGDVCSMNAQGLIKIKGRADDMIIKAGMNIYPAEIENYLTTHKAIKEVVAYGISTQTGQEIALDIVLAEGCESLSKRDLYAICGEFLPVYLLPYSVNIVSSLQRNGSGKIVRPRNK